MNARWTFIVSVVFWTAQPACAQPAVPKAWAACAACHLADGAAGLGPSLQGVAGRKAGAVPGFGYSRAMRSSGIVWDEKSLTAFLTEPQKVVPGNRMPFSGIGDPREVAAIVEYLQALR